jgi:hypothetical protein
MHEPDVVLTDFALALECAILAWLLLRRRPPGVLRRRFVALFIALGIGACLGAISHGFFPHQFAPWYDAETLVEELIWRGTMAAIGIAALAAWGAAARILGFEQRTQSVLLTVGVSLFLTYLAWIIFVSDDFRYAILYYTPAAVFLWAAFIVEWRRDRDRNIALGMLGMALTFVAAGIQQAEINLHPRYFNYNALYHVVQGVGLFFIYRAAGRLIGARSQRQPSL